MHFTYFTRV